MSVARARAGHDVGDSKPVSGDGVSSGDAASTLLKCPFGDYEGSHVLEHMNRHHPANPSRPSHPALIAHVNDCDECLSWLLALSTSMVLAKKRRGPK